MINAVLFQDGIERQSRLWSDKIYLATNKASSLVGFSRFLNAVKIKENIELQFNKFILKFSRF